MESTVLANASKFLSFLNKSPTPFHVCESARLLLKEAGFAELKLAEPWTIKNSGKYFVTKNESTLYAFAVGAKYESGNGLSLIGAHTDSPCLKLKLISKRTKQGYLQCGVETYGGGIWHTWFDRDLSLAGRVLLKKEDGTIKYKLVHFDKPILKIPNLAIHLDRETNTKFAPNKESHLVPILATVIADKLNMKHLSLEDTKPPKKDEYDTSNERRFVDKHHSALIDLICADLECKPDEIHDVELLLADSQAAQLGGVFNEFIFGPRLDNQVSSYCAIKALIDSSTTLESETGIRMACLYDHEEIGSESATGAASSLTEHIIRRLCDTSKYELAMTRSFLISADQAHAIHPNHPDKHEECHHPTMHGGIVLKYNGQQRYATNSITASIVRDAAHLVKVPIQDFLVKNDSPCGSTIGPIISAKLGMTSVDLGAPQLSMHSCRETGSTTGITQLTDLMTSFWNNYTEIRKKYADIM